MRCAKHKGCPRTTERKEETKKEARDAKDKMPAREPIRMRRAKAWLASVSAALPCMTAPVGAGARRGPRDGVEAAVAQTFRRYRTRERRRGPPREPLARRNVEVENAYRFQCAGWRSAEEYAQGEYGDEISWFSDSGLVEKVQNRQGLFMYFKRRGAASALPRWRSSPRRRGAGARRRRRDGVEAAVVQTFRRYRAREPWGLPREPLAVRVARRHRECLDKYLPRVKIFEYASDGGHK